MSIKFENTEVMGWKAAIRGMRNPLNSWAKSDSGSCVSMQAVEEGWFSIGENDLDLMKRLRNAGTDHRKFMRMITVYADITAPLYWWKELDTYKVGTVANSCSTMHKIHAKEFTLEDFSCEHLICDGPFADSVGALKHTVSVLNFWRNRYNESDEERDNYFRFNGYPSVPSKKDCWRQLIQLLPSSYNQKRTVMLNYEVLANIYKSRKNHKLDEWSEHEEIITDIDSTSQAKYTKPYKEYFGFCDWIKTLPYHELITGKFNGGSNE